MPLCCSTAVPRALRIIALACLALLFLPASTTLRAHEGDNHGIKEPSAGGAPLSPRAVASTERYQFVGILEGEVLVIYLDRADTNAPVTGATLKLEIDGASVAAVPIESNSTYEATVPGLRKPGAHEFVVAITDGNVNDLLVAALVVPDGEGTQAGPHSIRDHLPTLKILKNWGIAPVVAVGLVVAAVVAAAVIAGRRMALFALVGAIGIVLAPNIGIAREGHDHGPDLRASSGNSPSRRPDGSIFLPKPSQRLLRIRTQRVDIQNHLRTVRFNGRIVANPNRSGIVQSTIPGRYQAPESGVLPLGTRVNAGDLLGMVMPSFASVDASDMAQTLGNLDQEISLSRTKLTRQEHLLQTNVVARAAVEDTRLQLEGLEKRRRELLAARVKAEELRAPVDGVIAATRVVAGQVVAQADQLFQIIDPSSLLVEALVFDQINPDGVTDATALVGTDTTIKLKFLGRSRALQQQYSIMQFQILDPDVRLNVGAPVTVIAATGERVIGILLPRSALAQAPNGQTVVFSQKEPELFMPRPVRVEPFDSQSVLITGGLEAGEKIVIENAPLVNQVR